MKVTLASSVCLAALTASSFAGDCDAGKMVIENPCCFYVQAVGGASFFVSGDLLGEVNLDNGGIGKLGFDDVYENAATYGLRVGRACERTRIYVGFEYTEAAGEQAEIGDILNGNGFNNHYLKVDPTIVADFSDYSDYGLVLGFERDLFSGGKQCVKNPVTVSRFRPWVGAQIGIRFVDGISASTHLVDLGGSVVPGSDATIDLYDDSVVFTAALTLGIAYDITDRISIGVESGLRYQTGLDEIDDDLDTLGFGAANDDSDALAIPVLGTVAIKF